MKKMNFLKLAGFFLFLLLITQSCRNESLALEQDTPKYNYNIAVLNKEQFEGKTMLFNEITNLKSNFFRPVTTVGKTVSVQDPILDGAIIETDRVLEITDGTHRTYTFPVSRTFSNDKIENLVLRENPDNTYSGALMQYSLTKQEKDLYTSGAPVDLTGKIKVYSINNVSIAGKGDTFSYYEGCWEYVYETNPCTASGHHDYGDTSCPVLGTSQQAQPAQMIAAYNHCGDSGGGSGPSGGDGDGSSGNTPGNGNPGSSTGDGSTGGGPDGGTGTPTNGGSGGSSQNPTTDPNANPYNTFLMTSFDDMFDMCAQGDDACEADRQINLQVQQYLMTLPTKTRALATYNPILWTIKDRFINFGSGDDILTERLNLVANWFNAQNNTNADAKLENFKVASWALNLLLEDDTQDFQNFFNRLNTLTNAVAQNPNLLLDIPCSQLPEWQAVANQQVPISIKNRLLQINGLTHWYQDDFAIQNLDSAAGPGINMDLFPVRITSMPYKPGTNQRYTPAEFFDFFRRNINQFAETFSPLVDSSYGINDTSLWFSNNPLGALIHIEIPGDNGTVVCSGFNSQAWVFTTIKAPITLDGQHPVSGNRLFGYFVDSNGFMYLYTRGVDRFTKPIGNITMTHLTETFAFSKADELWKGMQTKLENYINSPQNGGLANKLESKTYRPAYSKVKMYLKNQAPLSSLGCN